MSEGTLTISSVDTPWDMAANPFRIDHADPVARIHAELLNDMEQVTADSDWHPYGKFVSVVDDVLTIRAKNRTVVYVIERDQYDAQMHSYRMHWPD
jgi:hypothetical protein